VLGCDTTTLLFSLFSLSDLPLHLTITLILASLLPSFWDSAEAFLGDMVPARDLGSRADMEGTGELRILGLFLDELVPDRTGGRIEPWAVVFRSGPVGNREEPFMAPQDSE
jgi:hypothetical protein